MGTTQKCLFETRAQFGEQDIPRKSHCAAVATMVKCPLSLLAMGSGKPCLWPLLQQHVAPTPPDLESCSYYSWLLPRVNSDAPVWGGGDIVTTAWHLKIKLCLGAGGRRKGDVYLLGSVCLWLLSQRDAVHARWRPCLHTVSIAFLIFVSLRFHWKSLFYKCK